MAGRRGYAPLSPSRDDSRVELLPVKSHDAYIDVSHVDNGGGSAKRKPHDRTPTINGWPQKARTLKKTKWKTIGLLLIDVCIALIPLLFIALSITAIDLSGSPTSTVGSKVRAATNLGPTIFPILFAAIVGRSLRSLASFQAERGVRLSTLEQMMGSLTLFKSIELQASLRTLNLFGVGLILLWTLSPLGGQASLRLLTVGKQSSFFPTQLFYLCSDSSSIFSAGADTIDELGFLTNSLYTAALFTPMLGQVSPVDTWGNIKIPQIEDFESTSNGDTNGWYNVLPENESYSSLVGLPIMGIERNVSYNFSLESTYLVANCSMLSSWRDRVAKGGFSLEWSGQAVERTIYFYPNQTAFPAIEPTQVRFNVSSNNCQSVSTNCTLTRSSVESNVTCNTDSCSVTQVRRSRFDRRPPNYIALQGIATDGLGIEWRSSGGSEHPGQSTPTEFFIKDPTMMSLTQMGDAGCVNLSDMAPDDFSRQFSLVLNTYYQLSLAPLYQTGNFPVNTSDFNTLTSFGNDSSLAKGTYNATSAVATLYGDIYICDKAWAAILLVASTVLLLFGLCGAIVKYMTRSPQILGYVSSMTRDNPYVNLPSGGCTLDGLERARLLKDLRVKVQDVAAEGRVGHIALSSAETPSKGRLTRERLYAGAL